MSSFPLLDLESTLLERILRKFQLKSYCRIQQTSKTMADFIYNNRRVKIYMKYKLSVVSHDRRLVFELRELNHSWPILNPKSVESLNGIHFEVITPLIYHVKSNTSYITVCKRMRPVRISCTSLYLCQNTSTDECEKYVEALKPSSIEILTGYRRLREGFLHAASCNGVKTVKSSPCHYELLQLTELLLSAKYLERIHLAAAVPLNSAQEQLNLFISILKLLRGRVDLRYFYLSGRWLHPLPPIEEILNKLWQLSPMVEEINDSGFIIQCNIGSNRKLCKFSLCNGDNISKKIFIHFSETADTHPMYMLVRDW